MEDFIDLVEIQKGFEGLTQISGAHMLEGCIVTLWFHDHKSNLELTLLGKISKKLKLAYPEEKKTLQLANTWRDKREATELAAACIGILLAWKLESLEVTERAASPEGVDYWLGTSGDGIMFQRKARLEVSGILKGTNADMEYRYKQKCIQSKPSDGSKLPAFISVTEFSKPVAKFQQR